MDKKYQFTFKIKDSKGHVGLHVHMTDERLSYPEDCCAFINRNYRDYIKFSLDEEIERIVSIPVKDKNDSDKCEQRIKILHDKIDSFMNQNNILGFIWEGPEAGDKVIYPNGFKK
ncbi:hypothetical protein [Aeromonas encheleia]|uniref:Uncharacterized protein n=1 Tax=Aeromonas encheleia TaxID=73010 RepID=A0AAE9MCU0_9GAMM|nr:hypothetical protein [Aeromonas encheleia]USV55844.1 hypothetical protein NHF51_10710 [Aeromonas encheleia]